MANQRTSRIRMIVLALDFSEFTSPGGYIEVIAAARDANDV